MILHGSRRSTPPRAIYLGFIARTVDEEEREKEREEGEQYVTELQKISSNFAWRRPSCDVDRMIKLKKGKRFTRENSVTPLVPTTSPDAATFSPNSLSRQLSTISRRIRSPTFGRNRPAHLAPRFRAPDALPSASSTPASRDCRRTHTDGT